MRNARKKRVAKKKRTDDICVPPWLPWREWVCTATLSLSTGEGYNIYDRVECPAKVEDIMSFFVIP